MPKPKRPTPVFEALFVGPGIYPEMVTLPFLSRTLSAVQRLAAGRETGEEEESGLTEGKIGLLQVRRGSALYQFSTPAPAPALAHLREAGRVLERPETIGDRDYILSPVEELSTIAKRLDCSIVLREPGKGDEVLARIEPASYTSISEKLFVTGETAITGKVERVGGATERKCGLRVPGQSRMLICRVETTEAARKLGQKLYEEVVVHGAASWLKTSWKIVAFKVKEVYQPRLRPAEEAMEVLREAGGKGWDQVDDPEAYIEEVSGKQ
jgi:hypothetical protein